MPVAEANGIRISYEVEGDGPPLIMITGTGFPGGVYRTGPSAFFAPRRLPGHHLRPPRRRRQRQAVGALHHPHVRR